MGVKHQKLNRSLQRSTYLEQASRGRTRLRDTLAACDDQVRSLGSQSGYSRWDDETAESARRQRKITWLAQARSFWVLVGRASRLHQTTPLVMQTDATVEATGADTAWTGLVTLGLAGVREEALHKSKGQKVRIMKIATGWCFRIRGLCRKPGGWSAAR